MYSASVTEFVIKSDDPGSVDVMELLRNHLAYAQQWSLPGDVDVLDLEQLTSDPVFFFSAREENCLLGIGALSPVEPGHIEIKSMHTADHARGRGVGRAVLEHLVMFAREKGFLRVSLETGMGDAFAPARALYRSGGFRPCSSFGAHQASTDSICMTLPLSP